MLNLLECLHQGKNSKVHKVILDDKIYAMKEIDNLNLMECLVGKLGRPGLVYFDRIDYNATIRIFYQLAVGTLKDSEFGIIQLWDWIKDLILALNNLHSLNILHGDIKTENILLYDNGKIKLGDFGNCKFSWTPNKGKWSYTVTHRAPEIWLDLDWGVRADIWALGCTLYHIVTGDKLFPVEQDLPDYLVAIYRYFHLPYSGNSKGPKAFSIPAQYKKIGFLIKDCLQFEPDKRLNTWELLEKYFAITPPLDLLVPDNTINPKKEREIGKITSDPYLQKLLRQLSNKGDYDLSVLYQILRSLLYLDQELNLDLAFETLQKLDWKLWVKI